MWWGGPLSCPSLSSVLVLMCSGRLDLSPPLCSSPSPKGGPAVINSPINDCLENLVHFNLSVKKGILVHSVKLI